MMWLPTVQFIKTFKSFFKEKVLADICFLLLTLYNTYVFTMLLDMLLKLLPCKYFCCSLKYVYVYCNNYSVYRLVCTKARTVSMICEDYGYFCLLEISFIMQNKFGFDCIGKGGLIIESFSLWLK